MLESKKKNMYNILCHFRGQNRVDFTISSPKVEKKVMFEIYNIPPGCCKFQTSRRDVVNSKHPGFLFHIATRPNNLGAQHYNYCAVNVAGHYEINP
jgi:hypothetical protein